MPETFSLSGEYIKAINRPNSSNGWEGVFKFTDGILRYEPGLRYCNCIFLVIYWYMFRQLILDEYLDEFFMKLSSYPRTVILFRDQSHLALTADIISELINKLGMKK